ncbi:stage II sporulation protein P [Bacillus chungangensis]|uniref:Uncharacterized protein n=1 Tax=Bacillus chungangensis TaxID=587633 RepID=A0ABT9WTY4_9BACI|nr:hypothetical protein [Bacillus chungangensis]
MYPEVSKGILMNNEVKDEYYYNQDLHPHVVVINIGGPKKYTKRNYQNDRNACGCNQYNNK